jgi:hypothetical protein
MPLARALDRLRRDLGVPTATTSTTLESVAQGVLGPLFDQVSSLQLRKTVLIVVVAEPAVAQAVRFRARGLVDALLTADPPVVVSDVQVRVDGRSRRRPV